MNFCTIWRLKLTKWTKFKAPQLAKTSVLDSPKLKSEWQKNPEISTLCYLDFSATLILREINFGWFQMVKNCHFNHFGCFEFWFLSNFTLENVKNSQKFKIQSCSNVQKWQFLGLQNGQNWFQVGFERKKNPKILHCVFPLRLHRSVCNWFQEAF